MKYNTLVSCAVASAMAAAANAVHATDITAYPSNQFLGLNVDVYISGSIAIDNALNSVLQDNNALQICASPVNEYQAHHLVVGPKGTIPGASETLWYCPAGARSGVSSNLFLAIFKEDTAGSINAAQPLIAVAKGGDSSLTFLNPLGPNVQAGTCATSLEDFCTAGDFSQNIVPTGGISDVEATLLRTVPGGGKLSSSDVKHYLTAREGRDIVWGLGVSKNLYYALQSAESLVSKCSGGNLDSPTCAPSLSKSQVASILNGQIVSWSQLGMNNPSGDNNVYICRGDLNSGAEISFEAYFLGAGCGTSSESMVPQSPPFVVEQKGIVEMLNCLEEFDLGGNAIYPYNNDYDTSYQPFTPTGHQWAVGVLSTELTATQVDLADQGTDPQTPGTGTLRMVAIDGILPTLENVVNGYDPYWGTDVAYTIGFGDGVPYGNPLEVFDAIQFDLGHNVTATRLDFTYVNAWGDGGELSTADRWFTSHTYSSWPVNATTVENTPINQFTKATSGAVDNCDTPTLYNGVAGAKSAPEATLLGSGNVNQGPQQ